MATLEELHRRTEYMTDDTIDIDLFVDLVNECNEDISEYAKYEQVKTAVFYENDPIVALPKDFIQMVELKMQKKSETFFRQMMSVGVTKQSDLFEAEWNEDFLGYEVFGNQIEFRPVPKEEGSLLIRYYADVPKLQHSSAFEGKTDQLFLNQTPLIPGRFHKIYPLFAAMRYTQNWKDEQQAKNDFEAEYERNKQELALDGEARKTRTKSRQVYRTKSWN